MIKLLNFFLNRIGLSLVSQQHLLLIEDAAGGFLHHQVRGHAADPVAVLVAPPPAPAPHDDARDTLRSGLKMSTYLHLLLP